MPESLPRELIELRERAERFAVDVLIPYRDGAAAGRTAAAAQAAVREASRAAGFFGMTQPKAYGGSEAGPLALSVVRDTFAGYNTGFDRSLFGPGPGVLAGCAEPVRSRYLVPLMAGEKRSGFAFTEPDDAAHYTRAVPAGGGEYVVDGRKSYVTRGGEADFLNVLVDVPGEGRAVLVIDADAPGVCIERRFETLDGSHHAAFRFDSVRVPVDRMIGRPGEGLPRALGQIGDTRLAIAARAVGLSRWVVQHTQQHLLAPHRSGAALGQREGVRLRYADMRIRTFAARSMVYRTARLAESGANVVNEAIACKVFATEALAELVDAAMDLVGGKSLTVGHPLEALYRIARALCTAEGGADVLRLSLAKGSLDLGKGVL
ncbi:MAG: acyl-CoA dehydrogenase family protein [Gammaproteobacteria bacterium]|nr:acyl-CoA dehydrogenase family protein [Gammaproteobacteria bacterium]